MAISDYSTTAASNTSISGISLAENVMVPSDVNNAIRQMMADIKAGVPYLSGTSYLIESTDAGAAVGPTFKLYRNSATPAAEDVLGEILFHGEDSAGNEQLYGRIVANISDPTSTSEDGSLLLQAVIAGANTNYLALGKDAALTSTAGVVGFPGGKLSFPAAQQASSDANTFDDYEEGTFTPAFASSGATFSYNSQVGTYVKTGQDVEFEINIVLNTSGNVLTANALTVTGLPFAHTATLRCPVTVMWFNSTSSFVGVYGEINGSTTTITLFGNTAAATSSFTAVASNALLHITNGTLITISGSYRAAA
jgi:hypothetical protein